MKKKLFLFALPLFALTFTSCVKYNGKESANPVDKVKITLSTKKLSIVEGSSASITADVDRDVTINWDIPDEDETIASLDVSEGYTVTVSALNPGKTTVVAVATYNGHKFSAKCAVTVTRKTPDPGPDPSDPTILEDVTTYLVIGENGRYKGEPGKDIPSLYLEYAVEFVAKPGTDLPTAEDVTTVVTSSSFQYWQAYDGNGALTKYEKVPNVRGKILYACYGGGSGGVTPDPDPVVPTGNITLYFTGISGWGETDLQNTKVFLGINNVFTQATSVSNGYRALLPFSGSSFTINAYISQYDAKYFHPYSGLKDYDTMYSTINVGSVKVVDQGTYTITFGDWAYNNEDWSHAWFNYTFAEGTPGDTPIPPTPPVTTEKVTLYFAGVDAFSSISEVQLAVNGSFAKAQVVNSPYGKYAAEFTISSVTSINCYFIENSSQYRHPAGDTWDTQYSTIVTAGVTVSTGHSYAITWTGWERNWDNWEHAWFTYTFTQVA